MSRGESTIRTLRLLRLLENRRGWTYAELEEKLGCSTRTVMRDLQSLEVTGFPIVEAPDGREKRWSLHPDYRLSFPVPLSLTELLALQFARRLSGVFRDTPFHDSLESAYAKLSTLVPSEGVALLEACDDVLATKPGPFKDYSRLQALIQAVTDAAVDRTSLDIRYHTFSRGEMTERRLDPYRLFYFQGGLYVIGFDHLRSDIRIFALERILEWAAAEAKFERALDFDFDAHMQSALGIFRGEEADVRLRFHPSAAPFVKEREWHGTQVLETEDDGSVVLTMRVADTLELRRWVLSFGAEVEVVAPESLRDEVRNEAQSILERRERWDFATGQLDLPMDGGY